MSVLFLLIMMAVFFWLVKIVLHVPFNVLPWLLLLLFLIVVAFVMEVNMDLVVLSAVVVMIVPW